MTKISKEKTSEQIAMEVSAVSIVFNVILSAFKFIAGIIAHSGAMISDAVHSASDVLSTIVVIAGVKLANKASDKEHPYGHERMECVAAIILAAVLAATGIGIGYSGFEKIFFGGGELSTPGRLALLAAVVSIVIKEAMYWYTRFYAKKINSSAVMADAWHHRSDALSSVGSLIGIACARLGHPIFDPIASVVICLLIIKAAYDIFIDSVAKMTDTSCDDEKIRRITEIVSSEEGMLGIDSIKTRMFGDKFYVDIEIQADSEKTLAETHAVAQSIHDKVEEKINGVKHCMIHVNPCNGK